MPFGVVSGVSRGIGVLDRVEIMEREGVVLGANVGHPIVTIATLLRCCAKLCASMWYCGVDVAYQWLSDWTRL